MKKHKNAASDETEPPKVDDSKDAEAKEPVEDLTPADGPLLLEESTEHEASGDDLETQKLSEIESTEVAPADGEDATIDPDKEIIIKKTEKHMPWWKQRKMTIPLGIVLALVIIFAIPFTRFVLLGWAWHENVTLTIVDSTNNSPVTDAAVTLAGKRAVTDSQGKVTLSSVPLGSYSLHIEKANYKTLDTPLVVDVFSSSQNRQQPLVATGRPLSIRVTDRITGKPIADATFTNLANVAVGHTGGDGRATVVLPVSQKELAVSVAAGKYRVLTTKLTSATSSVQLVPEGSLYFLSKQSGKIDVVKTNLDGSDRKVIVPGTGDENDGTTTLLASQDWKYLVLRAKRAPNKPESLFLIDTSTDTMKLLDEGNFQFTLIGWSGHRFLYLPQNASPDYYWQAKQAAIKSYDAEKSASLTIDENANDPTSNSNGAAYESLGNYYILDNMLVYTKVWYSGGSTPPTLNGKQSVIVAVKPDGTGRKTLKSFSAATVSSISAYLSAPQDIYFSIADRNVPSKTTYAEYEDDAYKDVQTADTGKSYPTFLISPSGTQSFWYEERDGKNVLFLGDKNAGNKQELVAKSDFKPYGWLTDDYLLVQKSDSELYITTKDQLKAGGEPLKVSDYHKVQTALRGYGYGYGGL